MPTFQELTVDQVATHFSVVGDLILDPYTQQKIIRVISNASDDLINNSKLLAVQDIIHFHFPYYYGTKLGSAIQYYDDKMILSAFNSPPDTTYYYREYVNAEKLTELLPQLTVVEIMQIYAQIYFVFSHLFYTHIKISYDLSNMRLVKQNKVLTYIYGSSQVTFPCTYLLKIIDVSNTDKKYSMPQLTNNIVKLVDNEQFSLLLKKTLQDTLQVLQVTGEIEIVEDKHSDKIQHIINLFNYDSLLNRYLTITDKFVDSMSNDFNKFIYRDVFRFADIYKRILILPEYVLLPNDLYIFKHKMFLLISFTLEIIQRKEIIYSSIDRNVDIKTIKSQEILKQKMTKLFNIQKTYTDFLQYSQLK